MKRFKPILIRTNHKFEAGDIVVSARHKNKLLRFGDYENSYEGEVIKSFHIVLVDPEVEIKEGDYFVLNGKILLSDDSSLKNKYPKVVCSTNKLHSVCDGVKKEGESCTKNNNCIYPKCQIPQLSEQAIKFLIDYYNEHKCMPESVEAVNFTLDLINEGSYVKLRNGAEIIVRLSKFSIQTYHRFVGEDKLTEHWNNDCSHKTNKDYDIITIDQLNQQGEVDIVISKEETKKKLYTEEEVRHKIVNFYLEEDNWDEDDVEEWINKNITSNKK